MLRILRTTILVTIAVICTLPAMANSISPFGQSLARYNNIKPLQNPEWDSAGDVLKNKILDRKNKVVGSLNDVIVDKNGSVQVLKAQLDRMHHNDDIYFGYSNFNIRSSSQAYILGYDDSELEDLYSQILADNETAKHEASEYISVKKIRGGAVKSEAGKHIGVIQDIMFGYSGSRAEAVLIDVTYKSIRNVLVAVPFHDVNVQASGLVILTDDQIDAVINIAREK